MQERFGLSYFGEQGKNDIGIAIDEWGGKPAVLSSIAGRRGFNLQHDWNSSIVLNAQPVGKYWEQMLGRIHRKGQKADSVYTGIIITAQEQADGFEQAIADAHYIQEMTEQPQRLCFADYLN